ncbi:uncharacterized protein IL334_001810 [Kwoniella shivajii]|uniref:Uncharacterized protein n=1 Tax=Kwoniella shivajii TaxID=564305 RepID=A0ABZ1CU64_9TREE|nr:hypothetical protein IL334_001810 [Kwoniella shivajii]
MPGDSFTGFASDDGTRRQFTVPHTAGSPSVEATIISGQRHDHLIPGIRKVSGSTAGPPRFETYISGRYAVMGANMTRRTNVHWDPCENLEIARYHASAACPICDKYSDDPQTQECYMRVPLDPTISLYSTDALIECSAGHVINAPMEYIKSNHVPGSSYADVVSRMESRCEECIKQDITSRPPRWRVLDDFKYPSYMNDSRRSTGAQPVSSITGDEEELPQTLDHLRTFTIKEGDIDRRFSLQDGLVVTDQ